MIFEVFTNDEDESNALKLMNMLIEDTSCKVLQTVKLIAPDCATNILKKILKK